MFSNPIIRRYCFSQFRPSQVWVFGSLYMVAVLLLLFINTSVYRLGLRYGAPEDLFKSMLVQFGALQAMLLCLLCPANCSTVVAREITDKSFDFFRMLPLTAAQKTIGIVVGRNLFILLVSAVNLLICLALAVAGGLGGRLVLQLLAVLVTGTIALNLAGLLLSLLSFGNAKNNNPFVLLAIGLFALGPIMGMAGDLVGKQPIETQMAPFFGFQIPLLYLVSICLLYIAAWAFVGTLRRFTFEYEALFSRRGATLFLSSFLLLLLGLFYQPLYQSGVSTGQTVRLFWLIGLLPVWIVPILSMQSFARYVETSRRAAGPILGSLVLQSNILTGLILFATWLAFAAAVCLTTGGRAREFFTLAAVAFSFHAVILTLLENYTVLLPKNEKIGYLVSFVAILYCILPIILYGLFDAQAFAVLSPLQMFVFWETVPEFGVSVNPLVLNAALVVLLSIPIVRRYRHVIALTGIRNAA